MRNRSKSRVEFWVLRVILFSSFKTVYGHKSTSLSPKHPLCYVMLNSPATVK